jgi:hypothetical protein
VRETKRREVAKWREVSGFQIQTGSVTVALLKKAERIAIVGDSKSARDKTLLKRAMLLQ